MKRIPRLPLEWSDSGETASADGVTYMLSSESVRGESPYWTVLVFTKPMSRPVRRLHRSEFTKVESFGCTKAQARATAERYAWIRANRGPDDA